MGNIRFGYKNHCLESGVTFTPSTEAADHDADNLGKIHPSKFWRITTPSHATLNVVFPDISEIGATVMLYATATPHRNLFEQAADPSDAAWNKQNATAAAGTLVITGEGGESIPVGAIQEGVATGAHLIRQQNIVKPFDLSSAHLEMALGLDCYAEQSGAGANERNLRLEIRGTTTGDFAQANFDLVDGVVNSSSTGGNFSDVDASIVDMGDGYYRCKMACITDDDSSNLLDCRFQLLNDSFVGSYTGTSQSVRFGGAKLESVVMDTSSTVDAADIPDTWIASKDGRASYWLPSWGPSTSNTQIPASVIGVNGTAGGSDWRHFPSAPAMFDHFDSRGWVHSGIFAETAFFAKQVLFAIHDPDNTDSQLDISNIYIGPTWSPARNVAEDFSWDFDAQTGARILTLTIAWGTEAEAKADAMPMALTAGVGIKSAAIADGGQEFRRDRKPVLVILDPDATTYAQEDMIYGWIDEFRIRANKYIADVDGAGNSGLAYAIEMKIKEVLP